MRSKVYVAAGATYIEVCIFSRYIGRHGGFDRPGRRNAEFSGSARLRATERRKPGGKAALPHKNIFTNTEVSEILVNIVQKAQNR